MCLFYNYTDIKWAKEQLIWSTREIANLRFLQICQMEINEGKRQLTKGQKVYVVLFAVEEYGGRSKIVRTK